MSSRITPLNVEGLHAVYDTGNPVTVSRYTEKTTVGPTRNISEYEIETSHGKARGFLEKEPIESGIENEIYTADYDTSKSSNAPAISTADYDMIKSRNAPAISTADYDMIESRNAPAISTADYDMIESRNAPAISTAEDDKIKQNIQLAVSNQTSVALIPQQSNDLLHVTEFVPVPYLPTVSPTFPPDPYNFLHFQHYIKSKLCYNSAPLAGARIMKTQERVAYRVDMWSLMEYRSVQKKTRPYRDEDVPGTVIQNIFDWKDVPVDTPKADTDIKFKTSFPLEETQSKIRCDLCSGNGSIQCSSCYGQGHLLRNNLKQQCTRCHGQRTLKCTKCQGSGFCLTWFVMTIAWHSLHTVSCCQNTFLPEKMIRRRLNKKTFFEGEREWTNNLFLTQYEELYQTILERSPSDLAKIFGKEIQKQYQSHFIQVGQSMMMRRIKCLIRQVDVIEADYQLEGYANKSERHRGTDTFTYLLYGVDEDRTAMIYENDYPLNCCGCLGSTLACRCGCCIS